MFLTRLLAFLVGMNNMKTFDLLCKGMDARVKCERLRKAAKQAHPLGPIFTDQLSRFEQKSIAVRNKVSHSWPVLDNGTIYFCNVKTGAFRPENFEKDGTEMLATDLFMEGLWLNAFSKNVCSAINNVSSGGPLEVVFDGQSPPQEAQ